MDRSKQTEGNEEKKIKPNSETLHTTDPEKNMEGPVSSVTRKTGEAFDSGETKENADQKRDERM